MKPIVKWTLRQRRTSTIWWSVGMAAFIFINMIFYPSFKNDAAELQKSFENLPDAALQLLGGSSDFFSPVGFVNSQIYFLTLPLVLSILSISLGSRLLAYEETNKTIESLLARPVSRSRLLLAKATAGLVIVTLVNAVSWAAVVILARVVNLEVPLLDLTLASLVCYIFVVTVGSLAYLLTAIGKTKGASIGISVVIAFGGYIISSLAGTVSWLQWPAKIFPFEYYQSEAILRGTYNWLNLLYFFVIIAACAGLSWVSFRARDLE